MRYIYVLLNSLLNGISTPILKKLGEIVPIYPVIFLRGIISLTLATKLRKKEPLKRLDYWNYVAVIALAVVGYFTYYTALKLVDVGLVAVFTINGTMLITLLFASVYLRERHSVWQWLCIIISLLSLTAVVYESMRIEFNLGIVLLIVNSFANSTGAIFTKKILDRRCGNELFIVRVSVDVLLSLGVLVVTPLLIVQFIQGVSPLIGFLIVYLGINSIILSLLSNKSVRVIGVGLTELLRNFTTPVVVLVGVCFLGERYTLSQYLFLLLFSVSTFAIIALNHWHPKGTQLDIV